ncbi:hypothetical protein FACS1894184_17070 [Clostridia bacterium]|nr:hypothetical protein FACS1894184_17070 [Clostridia bacterium]
MAKATKPVRVNVKVERRGGSYVATTKVNNGNTTKTTTKRVG